MAIVSNILNTLFDHIENKHKVPVEKLKILLNEYDQQQKDALNAENERQSQYVEKYEAKRNIQDEMYMKFLEDRQELYDKWIANKSKDTLYELLNLQYETENIPDIYTNTVFNTSKLGKTSNKTPVNLPPKPVPKPAPKPAPKPVPKEAPKPVPKEAPKPVPKEASKDKNLQCGIQNLGNSCYINSTLQYFIHLPVFNKILLDYKDPTGNPILTAYLSLYTAYSNKNVIRSDVEKLVNNLNDTLNDLDKIDVTAQQDASEFLTKFLDKIDIKELSKIFEIETELKIEFDKTVKKANKELKCNDEKEINKITDYSLFIKFPDKKVVYNIGTELTKAYDGIVEEVTKKGDYMECQNVTVSETDKKINKIEKFPYTRHEKVTKFPEVLNISLNIFDSKLKKIFTKTEIPNVWEYDTHKYRLNGIIVHKGESLLSGHYEYYSLEDGKWYEYSDSSVKEYKAMKPKASYYKLSTDDISPNIFYTNKLMPCPYVLSYVKQ